MTQSVAQFVDVSSQENFSIDEESAANLQNLIDDVIFSISRKTSTSSTLLCMDIRCYCTYSSIMVKLYPKWEFWGWRGQGRLRPLLLAKLNRKIFWATDLSETFIIDTEIIVCRILNPTPLAQKSYMLSPDHSGAAFFNYRIRVQWLEGGLSSSHCEHRFYLEKFGNAVFTNIKNLLDEDISITTPDWQNLPPRIRKPIQEVVRESQSHLSNSRQHLRALGVSQSLDSDCGGRYFRSRT
ncbi:WD repeat-containing protein 55 homolog [Caerostris extrusa]|uniref:WD repeat-containing protein 55 homolog n=1 Tax=Caerostris extrusa TaxID=172846 RepID=A0AAV4WFN3_CAEEX|nr:WD repeat-containing protein 55 homolog [Caerostris extrusa]